MFSGTGVRAGVKAFLCLALVLVLSSCPISYAVSISFTAAAADGSSSETVKVPRQLVREINMTDDASGGGTDQSFSSWLGQHWYVPVVVLVILVVLCVFVCACVLRRCRSSSRSHFHVELRSMKTLHSPTSALSRQQSGDFADPCLLPRTAIDFSPASLSVNSTPIPSPQPSFSSQRSARSSGRGSGRRRQRNHSPGHSSGSEETIRPADAGSVSSVPSSVSSLSHAPHLDRAQSLTTAERGMLPARTSYRGPRRASSSPLVKVNISGMGSIERDLPLHSASSSTSLGSNHLSRSTKSHSDLHSSRFRSDAASQPVVEVDVKVHLDPEQKQESLRLMTAAALAESARQLAQSAADFGDEEEIAMPPRAHYLPPRPPSLSHIHSDGRHHLFPNYSSSYLQNRAGSRPESPRTVQTLSLNRPVNQVSHSRPVHTFPIQLHGRVWPDDLRPSEHRTASTRSGKLSLPLPLYHSNVPDPRLAARNESETLRHSPVSAGGRQQYFDSYRSLLSGRPYYSHDSPHSKPLATPPEFQSVRTPRHSINDTHPNFSPPTVSLDQLGNGRRWGAKYRRGSADSVGGSRQEESEEEARVREGPREEGSLKRRRMSSLERRQRENGRLRKEERLDSVVGSGAEKLLESEKLSPTSAVRRSTLPYHYVERGETFIPPPSPSFVEMPAHLRLTPSKTRRCRPQPGTLPAAVSDPDLTKESKSSPDLGTQQASIPSASSTLPHSPSSSTCLSSPTSSIQSLNSQQEVSTLKKRNSLPNISHSHTGNVTSDLPPTHPSSPSEVPCSRPGRSLEESAHLLSSPAGGNATVANGSSSERLNSVPVNDSFSRHTNHHSTPQFSPPGQQYSSSQYSYPLQKLLAQPYDIDEPLDDVDFEPSPSVNGNDPQVGDDAMTGLRVHQLEYMDRPSRLEQRYSDHGYDTPGGSFQTHVPSEFHQELDGRISIEV